MPPTPKVFGPNYLRPKHDINADCVASVRAELNRALGLFVYNKLNNNNKAFIDIRLRPGIATLLATHRHTAHYGQNVTLSIKPEVHNISQRRQRRTEPRPQGICTTNFVKIGLAVPEICSRTHRHTDRQTDAILRSPTAGGVTTQT